MNTKNTRRRTVAAMTRAARALAKAVGSGVPDVAEKAAGEHDPAPIEQRTNKHVLPGGTMAAARDQMRVAPNQRIIAGMGSGDSSDINTYARHEELYGKRKYNMRDHVKPISGAGDIVQAEGADASFGTGIADAVAKNYDMGPGGLKPKPQERAAVWVTDHVEDIAAGPDGVFRKHGFNLVLRFEAAVLDKNIGPEECKYVAYKLKKD